MPTRVLHLLPSLHGADAARRVAMLCEALPRDKFEQHVATLNAGGAMRERLRNASAGVHVIASRFRTDPFAMRAVRRLAATLTADVVHAWGADAVAHAALCRGRVVRTLSADEQPPRLVTRRTQAFTPPLAVLQSIRSAEADGVDMGLPPGARLIGAAAPLIPSSGLKELIWAVDLVRVMRGDVWLAIIGDGPQRESLEEFSRLACEEPRTLFLGDRDDLERLLPRFDLWWQGGRPAETPLALLEAQAAGLPVVADRCEAARQAIEDGVTGVLIARADRAGRAKATLKLLGDDELRRTFSNAASARAAVQWPAAGLVDACAALYQRRDVCGA